MSMESILPPLQCLRAFEAVADLGSFTRAGEMLGLTQTAVSHQIAQLEAHVGCRLFLRRRPGVVLTADGARLLPEVRAGLRVLREGIASVRPERRLRTVTVSTTPEFGGQWLAPRLEALFRDRPDLRVDVSLGYRRADLLAGEADVGIWLGPGGQGLKATRLGLDEEFAVCAPELDARLPARNALRAAPLLSYAGARHTVLDWRRLYEQIGGPVEQGFPAFEEFELGPEFATFAEMLDACARGEGFALVRTSLVVDDLASGRLVRCFSEAQVSDLHYHVVVPAAAMLRPEVEEFRAWLIAASSSD